MERSEKFGTEISKIGCVLVYVVHTTQNQVVVSGPVRAARDESHQLFLSTLHWRNLTSQQSLDILDLCSSKPGREIS